MAPEIDPSAASASDAHKRIDDLVRDTNADRVEAAETRGRIQTALTEIRAEQKEITHGMERLRSTIQDDTAATRRLARDAFTEARQAAKDAAPAIAAEARREKSRKRLRGILDGVAKTVLAAAVLGAAAWAAAHVVFV